MIIIAEDYIPLLLREEIFKRDRETGKMKKITFSFILSNDKGSVLAIALIIMVVLSLIGVAAFVATNLETHAAKNDVTSKQTFQAAEAVSEYAISQLRSILAKSLSVSPTITTLSVPTISGVYCFHTCGNPGHPFRNQHNPRDLCRDVKAKISHYTLTTTATNSTTQTGTAIVRQLDDQLIPLFQFGVFYNKLLEIFPGATMTFNGRIHSNADIKLGTHATLTTNLKMTSGGTITQPSPWHGGNFSGTVTVSSQESGVSPSRYPSPQDPS